MLHQLTLLLLGAALARDAEAEAPAPEEVVPAFLPGCAPVDLDTQVELALTELTDAEFDAAVRVAEEGVAALPCLPRVADPDDLATLWLVLGAAQVYQGAPPLAVAPFRQAGAVYPGWFNDRLGSQAREAWATATADLAGQGTVTAWPIPDGALLYVDGAAREGREAQVLPGDHLVQVAVGAEVQFARVVTLADGQVVDLITGLPEPTISRFSWPLSLGVLSFLASGGAVAGAILLDQELAGLSESGSAGQLRLARYGSVGLAYVGTPLLLAGAGVGVTKHVQRRRAAASVSAPE